jgi:hypothetical protein
MTQAFNLSQFANKLNSSGQTDNTGLQNNSITINTTSPITGGATPALGGSMTIAHANSGVTATSYTNANITVNAQGHITAASNGTVATGTVTSVATGNGLQGGTITSSGTLSVACPGANTVGSYCTVNYATFSAFNDSSFGGNYGMNYVASWNAGTGSIQESGYGAISGTWKLMSQGSAWNSAAFSLACRVA